MHENSRELKSKLAIAIFVGVFGFISIYLLVMYFINSPTRSNQIELADATFELNNRTYSAYCEFNQLLNDESIIVDQTQIEKRLPSKATQTIDVTLKANAQSGHEHIIHITVKNVFDHAIPVKDAIIYKLSIDINSIQGDCNIKFLNTPIVSLIRDDTAQEWTERFGQPEISGSFETKKYSWVKHIKQFDSTIVLIREFGNRKYLSIEIQNVDNLFKS